MQLPIYMDCHATTPIDPVVWDAMLPYWTTHFGNAASRAHAFGWVAAEAVERARAQVAAAIGASVREIVFTSGATESIHLALRGALRARRARGRHVVTTAIEHKAVLGVVREFAAEGWDISIVAPRPDGIVDPEAIAAALRADTVLVAVMTANNEIGTLQPLAAIGALLGTRDILFFTDAAQAVGKVPIDVRAAQVDLLAMSAHKLYGPKGVGALYVRGGADNVHLEPSSPGGGQEHGLRSGTLNVPAIVGLGKACEVAAAQLPADAARVLELRERLRLGLQAALPDVRLNGALAPRLPGNLNLGFAGVTGESLLMQLNDIAVSPGAACDNQNAAPSHVLRAIGVPDDLARSSIRFGLGRFNSVEEVDYVIGKVTTVVQRLRATSPQRATRAEPEEVR